MYLIGEQTDVAHLAEARQWSWKKYEIDMVNWWLFNSEGQAQLRTRDNEQIIVLHAGELNDGPGPDIVNCHLFLNDLELSGSVEMHQKADDWYRHNHDADPAYENVILHVVADSGHGPNMATLILDHQRINRVFCPALRPVLRSELLSMARNRFEEKAEHIQLLSMNSAGLSPLFLGIFEVIIAGCHRHQRLNEIAALLELPSWPDKRIWKGSRQSYPTSARGIDLVNNLIRNMALFEATNFSMSTGAKWREWDQVLQGLRKLGLSNNQTREWLINILAPFNAERGGFELWLNLLPFRSYGFESRICPDLGMAQIESVAEQQALLAWNSLFCRKKACFSCPLSRTHQRLARID